MQKWQRKIVGTISLDVNEDVVRRAMIKCIPGKINDSADRVETPGTEIDGVREQGRPITSRLSIRLACDFDSIPDLIEPRLTLRPHLTTLRLTKIVQTGQN